MKKFILFAICMITFCSAKAYDFEHNGFYYNILSLSDLTVELTCNGVEDEEENTTASYTGDITIPRTTEYANRTFTVVQINPLAFVNCSIGTLTIPETIESIGEGKKWYLNRGMYGNFSNLVVEDSETPIKCTYALVDSHVDRFSGERACDVINSVYLGRDIECSVVCQGIVYNHDDYDPTGGSYKKITFGSKVTSIPNRCCNYCVNLIEVNIPNNIKSIKSNAFLGCKALTTVHGEYVAELGDGAFSDCQNLTSFNFPVLRSISDNSFARCTSLKDVVLPSGVAAIYGSQNGGAFNGCTSLENIVIPSTIVKMGQSNLYSSDNHSEIFVGCSSLKTLSVDNPTPIDFSESNLDMLSFLSTTLKVPVGAKAAYSEAEGWKNFLNIVEDPSLVGDIYTISYKNFSYCGTMELEFEDALESYALDNTVYRFAKKGTEITINIEPESGYIIESLFINGVDVASEVVSNTYSFMVTGSVTISVEYDYNPQPQKTILLSIKQADNGCVNMKVRKGNTYSFIISPAEGWKIHSVSYNGEDMTSDLYDGTTFNTPEIYENSELVLAFEEEETGFSQIVASRAKVIASSGNITVKDALPSEDILVCDESGLIIANCKGNNTEQVFPISKTGVYIVKVGNKTIKFAL